MPVAYLLNVSTDREMINAWGAAKHRSLPQSSSVTAPSSEGAKGYEFPVAVPKISALSYGGHLKL